MPVENVDTQINKERLFEKIDRQGRDRIWNVKNKDDLTKIARGKFLLPQFVKNQKEQKLDICIPEFPELIPVLPSDSSDNVDENMCNNEGVNRSYSSCNTEHIFMSDSDLDTSTFLEELVQNRRKQTSLLHNNTVYVTKSKKTKTSRCDAFIRTVSEAKNPELRSLPRYKSQDHQDDLLKKIRKPNEMSLPNDFLNVRIADEENMLKTPTNNFSIHRFWSSRSSNLSLPKLPLSLTPSPSLTRGNAVDNPVNESNQDQFVPPPILNFKSNFNPEESKNKALTPNKLLYTKPQQPNTFPQQRLFKRKLKPKIPSLPISFHDFVSLPSPYEREQKTPRLLLEKTFQENCVIHGGNFFTEETNTVSIKENERGNEITPKISCLYISKDNDKDIKNLSGKRYNNFDPYHSPILHNTEKNPKEDRQFTKISQSSPTIDQQPCQNHSSCQFFTPT